MTGKRFKIGLIASGALMLLLLVAGLSGAAVGARENPSTLSEYVGSQACFGCHTERFENWSDTGHAHMLVRVFKPSDLPGDLNQLSPELKAEVEKAQYIVAGQRFIARDPQSGALSYLNVQWNAASGTYAAYKGGSNWEQSCAGCHTTGWAKKEARFAEAGIGCEACHGPGREHILARGDRSKIVKSTDADVCGVCHNGGKMADGQRWPEGFKPGMKVWQTGFMLTPVSKTGPVPAAALHLRQFAMLDASGHLEAVGKPFSTHHDNPNCYTCHSAEARIAAEKGTPIRDIDALRTMTDGVSCVACHDPHKERGFGGQLRMSAENLCISCHNGSIAEGTTMQLGSEAHHPHQEMLQGYGALGVAPTKGAHTSDEISCVDCHMSEGNHLFKVIMPKTTIGTTRKDSCVLCHTNSSAQSRGAYVEMWQEQIHNRLQALQANLALADAIVKANPNLPADLADKVKLARSNISFVEADGSRGAHNFEYAMKILVATDDALAQFLSAVK